MNVSSVKNLNGEVFSAVQDASLTNVVQSNSAQWAEGGVTFDTTYMSAQIDNKLNKSEIGFRKVNSIDYVSGISGKNISAKFAYRANTAYNADHATTASYDDNGNSLTTTYYNAQEANNKASDLFNFVQSNSANWEGGSSPSVDNKVLFYKNYSYDPSIGSQNKDTFVSGATELYFEAAVDSQLGTPSEIVFYRNGSEIGRAYWTQVSSDGSVNYLTASYNNADGGDIQIQNYNNINYNWCNVSANGVKTQSFNQGSYNCGTDKEVKFNIIGSNIVGQIIGLLHGNTTQLTSFTGGLTDFTAKGYEEYDTLINSEDSNNSHNYNLSAEFGGSAIAVQEVSHDNTLSGNGTVESPLGVVPGYNETVLWSGSWKPGDGSKVTNSAIEVSESIGNFEYIRVVTEGIICQVITVTPNQCQAMICYPESDNRTSILGLKISKDDETHLRFRCGFSNSYIKAYRENADWGYFTLKKIIGINRKA